MIKSLQKLDAWIEAEQYLGWDPHDALNSLLLSRITFNQRRLGQVWLQLLKRSPINFRLLLGVPKGYNPKGMGLFLSTYARRYARHGSPQDLEKARYFADWLTEHTTPGFQGCCWGYNFDWPNRGFFAPAGSPTVVNTAFIGLAFLDLDAALVQQNQPTGKGLAIAKSACRFLLNDLHQYSEAPDEICLSYTPLDRRWIHNANVLGGWLLSEVSRLGENQAIAETALKIARFTARRQGPDGSWPYGTAPMDSWIDNFHTGYVLVALKKISENLKISEFDEVIAKGYQFWKANFFLPDGTPKYYSNKLYPIDSHCVAQAVRTFLAFPDQDPQALEWAVRVADWGIRHMQDRSGYFYYQIRWGYINKIPYMRWAQAWMQLALTDLSNHL